MDDQSVEKMRQHYIATGQVIGFAFLPQETTHSVAFDDERRIGQARDLDHFGFAQVEHVTEATQNVVVDHGSNVRSGNAASLTHRVRGDRKSARRNQAIQTNDSYLTFV